MAWVTPVTDRAQSDITNKTSKGYFNVADWVRIYGDTQYVHDAVVTQLGLPITFTTISTPTTATIPTVTDLNTLIQNIENIRAVLPSITGMKVLKTDWVSGLDQPSPNYQIVNYWESNLLLMYTWLALARRYAITGVAVAGASMTKNRRWRP